MKDFQYWFIPEYSDICSRWEMKVDLSGVRYRLYISWNSILESWVLAIMDIEGNLILGGIRLTVGSFLLKKYKAGCPKLPPGEIWIQDVTSQLESAEVGRHDFKTRYKLCYGVLLDENGNNVEL